jgi:hypothetical protein
MHSVIGVRFHDDAALLLDGSLHLVEQLFRVGEKLPRFSDSGLASDLIGSFQLATHSYSDSREI